jgi:hypothetical protein
MVGPYAAWTQRAQSTNNDFGSDALGFQHLFRDFLQPPALLPVTKAGRWQAIRLPLEAVQAAWFERAQPNAPAIDSGNIPSFGATLADKKAGSFKLEVDWIGTGKDISSVP